MLKWFALKVLNIQFRPDLMKWFALKSLNINFGHISQIIFARDDNSIISVHETNVKSLPDPKNFLNASMVNKNPRPTLKQKQRWKKSPLSQMNPPRSPMAWLACSSPQISLLWSQQGYSGGKSNWSKLNHLQLNHRPSQVFATPKCQDLTSRRSSKLALLLLKGSKLFRKVYQPAPNWRYFLSLVIPNNYKSEMH